MPNIGKTKKKRGRPATGRDPSVTIRLPAVLLEWIDEGARAAGVGRSDMIRRLIEESRLGVPERRSQIRVAFHEAGHAVAARALGLPIKRATIRGTKRSLGHVLITENAETTSARLDFEFSWYSHIVVQMAGREAELSVLKFEHDLKTSYQDERNIKRLASWLDPETIDQVLDELRATTTWLVMKEFPRSIARVARALLAAETLDQKRVDRYIAETGESLHHQRPWIVFAGQGHSAPAIAAWFAALPPAPVFDNPED